MFYCEQKRSMKCPGKIKLIPNNTINSQMDHHHLPVDEKIYQLNFQNKLRTEAVTTEKSVNQIIRETTTELTDYEAKNLPTKQGMKRNIRRIRQRAKEVGTYINLQCEELETGTIIWDNVNLEECKEKSEEWFFDGTFKTCPRDFYQTYVCTTKIGGFCITPIQIVMKDKKQSSYEEVFDFVKDNSKKNLVRCRGPSMAFLVYILKQSILRRVNSSEILGRKYRQQPDFRKEINRLGNLSFVPKEDVVDIFDKLIESSSEETEALYSYFESTYVGITTARGRQIAPCFPIDLWNNYGRVISNMGRTNNVSESFNSAVQKLTHCHPSLDEVKKMFNKVAMENKIKLQNIRIGERRYKKKKNENKENQIKEIVTRYCKEEAISFLDDIGSVLSKNS
ncbi:hypothetical protein SNEBB_004546 [Seison nebaliae]|nr:hypothetical protein SNEBB_004546 [Seison nebaliae]